ncbi:bifunctional diguanylate cyclase/phosphodiesterase [Anaerovorax odorimutans]|uniref:bifunctional diguanylate cyclase/phosphodiesterase n=1 Tax=Anaerovorax odorimutans TaxID=109327 RepID=UPI000428DF53|nr:EAL domain-containing protein [Anaerovorax odorimutans]
MDIKFGDKLINLKRDLFISLFITLSIFIIDFIVYITGGTEFVFCHLIYIPIIISAYFYGVTGGLVTAAIAGISLGPLMPVNVQMGIMQQPINWILRMIFLMAMGLATGIMFDKLRKNKEDLIKKSYKHVITGYPNTNKLKLDLNELIDSKKEFTLLVFKIVNLDHVNRYIDYKTGEKSIFKVIEVLIKDFNKNDIYSIYTNELVVLIRECSIEEAYIKAKEFLDKFKSPCIINGLPVSLRITSGIVNCPLNGIETNELFKKLGTTLDSKDFDGNGIYVYENSIAEQNKENYLTFVSLYDVLKNDNLVMVYQPKINIETNEVIGVEALLRYKNNVDGKINIEQIINVAEETGIINDITKWVINNTTKQLKKWKEEGLDIKIAINISSKDLKDNSVIEYTNKCINEYGINSSMLEFELTERTIVENEKKVESLLKSVRDIGLKISLDDFGTGYNSLIHLVNLPIDYIKIDKVFIDNVEDKNNRSIIEGIINLVKIMGKEVIAEGVETDKQLEILKELGCNNIQGYYFSKPLPPEELKDYILKFNK